MNLPLYITLLRTERTRTKDALKGPKALPENHNPNLKVYYVANLFSEWDNCVWFEVDNHEHTMDFVQNRIAKIPGIVQTCTLPTTSINKYFRRWK